ncbi:threonine-phosphate decarboxylase CobD [Pararhizobium haloflavum]|uniref:threonine-phosphate decarboxylase CobD n=1 Tax=Pararhizobium haloflavum TaxID=2037914 RepID=UPI000C1A0481|nr:threonine-phosphate decarboxylase CobD [Pararhizobium haloflavum]
MRLTMAHGGGLAEAVATYGGQPHAWLDLSTGINPKPVALPPLDETLWSRLPDCDLELRARRAAAHFYGTGEALPLPSPGTQAAIQHLPGLMGAPTRAAVLGPTYSEHAASLRRTGWRVDAIGDADQIAPHHQVVVIVNPNNPDGRLLSRDALVDIAWDVNAQGGTLIVDEAFADLDPSHSVADEAASMPGLIVLRSFGKFFGLAGLRLGFVIADADMQRRLTAAFGPWAVSGPALQIAAEVMSNDSAIERVRTEIFARNQALRRVLAQAGLKVVGDGGLFVLIEDEQSGALHDGLCRSHVLVRAFDYAPNWLRFGLASDEEGDERLARALAETRIVRGA